MRSGPPRFLERLLRAVLPPGVEGDSILGDLREEAAHRAAGGSFPGLWWTSRACGLAASYGAARLGALAVAAARELRWAVRGLTREPGSSAAAVLVIALGIGLSTTMVSVAYGLFLRDLDVPAAHELRVVEYRDPRLPGDAAPAEMLRAWRDAPGAFRSLAGFRTGPVNLAAEGEPTELLSAAWITSDAFDVLGVSPVAGRGFTEQDVEGGMGRVALLSHDLWRTRFAGRDVVGTDIRLDGRPVRVVGVMPPDFAFPMTQDLWLPTHPWLEAAAPAGARAHLVAFGRLRPGQEAEDAAHALERVMADLHVERRDEIGRTLGVEVVRFNEFRGGGVLRVLLGSMLSAALLVLAVAGANVAGLLLARTTGRLREVGLRVALGGGAVRIALPFLAQAALLATVGSLAGLGIASAGVELFDRAATAAGKPYWMHLRLDTPVLLFAAAVTMAVTLGAAAGPVALALRSETAKLLRAGGRGVVTTAPGRSGRALVVLQIALSCGLLVGSGLVTRSLIRLSDMDFPFAREDVLTADLRPPAASYPDAGSRQRLHGELLGRLRALPGVERAALAWGLPSLAFERLSLEAEGTETPGDMSRGLVQAWRGAGTPELLAVLAMDPVRGRAFGEADAREAEPVAVVEADLAASLFGNVDPVGRRFREVGLDGPGPWRRVVGVTGDLRLEGITDLDRGFGYYVPLAQIDPTPQVTLLLEGPVRVTSLAEPVRNVVTALDPDLAVHDVKTLRAVVGETSFFYRVFGGLFASFGVAGLLMACVGLYGLLSWSVQRRVPEMGTRMALGARPGSLLRLVIRDGVVQTAIGLVLGLGLALLAGDALAVLLFQVDPRDPLVYASVAILVGGVSLTAAALPALRAARLDPVKALRSE